MTDTQLPVVVLSDPEQIPKRILSLGEKIGFWVVIENAFCLLKEEYFDASLHSGYILQYQHFVYYRCLNTKTGEQAYLEILMPEETALSSLLISIEALDEALRNAMIVRLTSWIQERLTHKTVFMLQEPGRTEMERMMQKLICGKNFLRPANVSQDIVVDPDAALRSKIAGDAIEQRYEDTDDTIFLTSRYIDPCALAVHDQRFFDLYEKCCEVNKPDLTLWLNTDGMRNEQEMQRGRVANAIRTGCFARKRDPMDPLAWIDARHSEDETFTNIVNVVEAKFKQWGLL
jgi:thymidylate kinase